MAGFTLAAAGLCLVVAACAAILFLQTLPPVDDAGSRVATMLAAHHASALDRPAPSKIGEAVVAIEDRRFYWNPGVDPISTARVVLGALAGGSLTAGGATISQQLAKLVYVPEDDTIGAKLRTAGLAIKLNQRYSKGQILAMYLNAAYFGDGRWGIVSASQGYFGKTPSALTWAEASLLAGLPQAPSAYDPFRHLALARERQTEVLQALVRSGALSTQQATSVYGQGVDLIAQKE